MTGRAWLTATGLAALAFSGALLALPAIVRGLAVMLADDVTALLVIAVDDAWPVTE